MKVLLTATVQSHICQFHRALAEVLHQHGCEVHVAAKNNLAEKNGLRLDFADKIYDIPFDRFPLSANNLRAYFQLKKILAEERYDIIHCNTPAGGVVTRLAARRMRKRGAKVFYTAHGFHFYRGAPLKNWLFYYPIEKMLARMTDKLITITSEDFDLARRRFAVPVEFLHGVGVDEKRYFPLAVEEKTALRARMGFPPEAKIILCVGELLKNKNQQMAVRMMELLRAKEPDALLLLAGNGPQRENLEKQIADAGLQTRVRMLGYCTHLEDYQHIADVAVSCSYREGLPLNIVEAMLSGTPVAATSNRGHRELIRDGENGFLVKCGDVRTMASSVLRLLRENLLRQKIVPKAQKFVVPYGFTNVKKEWDHIYFSGNRSVPCR